MSPMLPSPWRCKRRKASLCTTTQTPLRSQIPPISHLLPSPLPPLDDCPSSPRSSGYVRPLATRPAPCRARPTSNHGHAWVVVVRTSEPSSSTFETADEAQRLSNFFVSPRSVTESSLGDGNFFFSTTTYGGAYVVVVMSVC